MPIVDDVTRAHAEIVDDLEVIIATTTTDEEIFDRIADRITQEAAYERGAILAYLLYHNDGSMRAQLLIDGIGNGAHLRG